MMPIILTRTYLSKAHIESAETGCPVAALGSETPRQTPEVRRAATRRIKEMIDLVGGQLPEWGQPGAHESALVTVATAVGAAGAGARRRRPAPFRRGARSGAEAPRRRLTRPRKQPGPAFVQEYDAPHRRRRSERQHHEVILGKTAAEGAL
jgi:hypothetical protein